MLCLAIIGISFSTTFDVMTSYRSIGIHSEKRKRERERESNQVYLWPSKLLMIMNMRTVKVDPRLI